jgi:cytochrome P450
MLARTDLPPVPIRGPAAPLLLGPLGGVLRFFADPVGRMLALRRDHGDLAAVSDGSAALVCAFGAEHNRTVITRPALFQHLSEVPIRVKPGTSFARFNNTVLLMNGDAHLRRRRLLMPAFTKAAVDGYAPEMSAAACEATAQWPIGKVADAAGLVRDLTVAIALRCLFGLRAADGTEELGRLQTKLLATIVSPLNMMFPFDLPGTPYGRTLRLAERVEQRIRRLIEEKRRQPGGTDMLSRLMAARDEDGGALSEDELIGESNSLFGAGYDTSAHTLAWTLLLLTQHEDVLDEVVEEIQSVTKGAPPAAEHLPGLVRLDRVLKESMRLLPTAILLFMRVCYQGAMLGDVALPEGAQIILSPLVTHRDPAHYPAPQRFDPARWAGLDPPLYTYLPFGVGPRTCIGASFAGVALRLTLARILQVVRPVLPARSRVDYEVRGPAMGPRGGLRLELAPPGSRARSARVKGTITELVDFD